MHQATKEVEVAVLQHPGVKIKLDTETTERNQQTGEQNVVTKMMEIADITPEVDYPVEHIRLAEVEARPQTRKENQEPQEEAEDKQKTRH